MDHFLSDLVPIVAILTVFGVPAAVIIIIAVLRHRQKMLIIGRGCASPDDFPAPYRQTPLLWGMVITAVSVAGIISASVQRDPDFAAVSILALASGLALLLYWLISAPQRRRERELYERKYPTGGIVCPALHTGAPLLWGMVITAVSVTGIIISLVRYEYDWANASILALTAGVALLAYWLVTAPQRRRTVTLFEQKCGQTR